MQTRKELKKVPGEIVGRSREETAGRVPEYQLNVPSEDIVPASSRAARWNTT